MATISACLLLVLLLAGTSSLTRGATIETPQPITLSDEDFLTPSLPPPITDDENNILTTAPSTSPAGGEDDFLIPSLPPPITDDGTNILTTEPPTSTPDGEDDFLTPGPPRILDEMMAGNFEMTNPIHVNGQKLFESDILLTPEQRMAMAERKGLISTASRWAVGSDGWPLVPYTFGDSKVVQSAVEAAIAHWEAGTCILFDNTTNLSQPHLRFIQGSGCWSYIGRISSSGGQDISIGPGCEGLGITAHEIGHAMGFYHEQSRPDRDEYILVNYTNMQSGGQGNFDKASSTTVSNFSVAYDYSSDMHYGGTYFNKNGRLTIVTKNVIAQELIGKRYGLSHRDKLLANRMYSCLSKWLTNCGRTTDPCKNDGYLGANCTCVCAPGTTGANCETVTGDYYDSMLSGCSAKVTAESTITSPDYPNNYAYGLNCVKQIIAPSCKLITVTFNSFQLYPQTASCENSTMCCYYDGLEIRTSNPYDGDWYCGQMIPTGTTFTSTNNQMIVYMRTFSSYFNGYSADVKFIPDPACSQTALPCQLSKTNNVFTWTTPDYGTQNYPNNTRCDAVDTFGSPQMSVFTFQSGTLQAAAASVCLDYVRFNFPYGVRKDVCGSLTGTSVKMPSSAFSATFFSDATTTASGFRADIQGQSSVCHKTITLSTVGQTGVFSTPNYPQRDTVTNRMCEVWIVAPATNKVRLQFLGFNLNTPCDWNSLVVNLAGNATYPVGTSTRHCGTTIPSTMTSTANKAYLVYMANTRNRGFQVRYTVIAQ